MPSLRPDSYWFNVDVSSIGKSSFKKIPDHLDKHTLFKSWPPRRPYQKKIALTKAENFLQGRLHIRHRYPDYDLSNGIVWKNPPVSDRNWRYLFQSLSFLDYLLVAYEDSGRKGLYSQIKSVCTSWWQNCYLTQNCDMNMAWHDHAIAVRLQQFLKALFFAKEAKDVLFQNLLYRGIYIHTRILDEDESIRYYEHNHGFDQACSLYLSSVIAPQEGLYVPNLRERSREWIAKESSHLLTEEGVQTENSPSYHGIICSDIYRMDHLISKIEKSKLFFPKKIQNNSLDFLTYMTQPDGFLPPLGDTQNALKPNAASFWPYEDLKRFPHYEYVKTRGKNGSQPTKCKFYKPESGYFSLRNFWDPPGENKATQLVVKCGFKAVGHRHDDDGTFLLYGLGEPWLIEGGWYSYCHDEKRAYVLSPEAHNVASPFPFRTRQDDEVVTLPDQKTSLELREKDLFCKSYMYKGYEYERHFKINGPRNFLITESFRIKNLKTRVEHFLKGRRYVVRLMFPPDKRVLIKDSEVLVKSSHQKAFLVIEFKDKPLKVNLIKGESSLGKSFYTAEYKTLKPAQSLYLTFGSSLKGSADFTYHIRLKG